MEKSLLL